MISLICKLDEQIRENSKCVYLPKLSHQGNVTHV